MIAGEVERPKTVIPGADKRRDFVDAAFYRSIIEQARDIILVIATNGNIIDANQAAVDAYGYTIQEMRNGSIYHLRAPETREAVYTQMETAQRQGILFRTVHMRKNGERFPVEVSSRRVQFRDGEALVSIIRDNSEIIKMERALREKEESLLAENKLFNSGPVVAYKRRPGVDGQFEYISPNISQFGYEQRHFLSEEFNYVALIHPEDIGRWKTALEAHEKASYPYTEIEYRIRRADGEYRWIYVYKMLLKDETGVVSGTQGYILDITERKNSERALLESEQKYQELVEAANVIIIHLNEKGQILFINEFGRTFFGFEPEELWNHSFKDTILPQFESTGRNLWDVFEDMFVNPERHEHNILENVNKNGQRVWIEWTNCFTRDIANGRMQLITVGIDVTARRRAEVSLKLHNERYRRNKLLNDLLENRISENEFVNMAPREGLCLPVPVACCLINVDIKDYWAKNPTGDKEALQAWLETAGDLISAHCGGVLWQGEREMVVLGHVSNQAGISLTSWVDNLSKAMQDFFRGVKYVLGVSAVEHEIKVAYRQAREAASIGPVFRPENNIFYWRDLGMCKLILEHAASGVGHSFIAEWLGALAEMPSAKNEELLSTLEELISGDPVTDIANRLHVHPKTVVFRKRKIEKILSKKLDDPEMRLNIAVALKLRKIQKKT